MPIHILGTTQDFRTKTHVVYGQVGVAEYLRIIGENFDDFEIQRRRERHAAYPRMKKDIQAGALLPSITLAVQPERVEELVQHLQSQDWESLASQLAQAGQVHILDGLQRTFILKELDNEGHTFIENQKLLLEFWLEPEQRHLIYRIIVLNAGQKRMSLKHQVELLFVTMRGKIRDAIPKVDIFVERENRRRVSPRQYPLNRLATSYQCFLERSAEVRRENIVAQELADDEILDASEETLNSQFNQFLHYLKSFADLDDLVARIYDEPSGDDLEIPAGVAWLGSDNVMHSFFAALGQPYSVKDPLRRQELQNRTDRGLQKLVESLNCATVGDDPLGLKTLRTLESGINPRKINVGVATRKLLTTALREYFRDMGETPIAECWRRGAE